MAGRQSKRTMTREERILACLRGGATRTAAAQANGIHINTLIVWMRESDDFRDAVFRAEAEAEIAMSDSLRRGSRKSWGAALAWLERRRPDDWREVREIVVRQELARVAEREGLDPAEVLAEAERIAAGGGR